jgi:hypothetical protein
MTPLTSAVLKAGIVSPDMLKEMQRFNPGLKQVEAAETPVDLETAANLIVAALNSEEYVLVRETDLEAVRQYLSTTQTGLLHLDTGQQDTDLDVTYGTTKLGEYIIAWTNESIQEMMTNGLSYLEVDGKHVYFKDVRDLFFGDQKAFMVCVPSTTEVHVDHS